jgi:hypothetical protein
MVSPNGRIKPDGVWMDGKEVRRPKGTYYIDYTDSSGKRARTSVGALAAEAQATRLRKEAELRAIAQGLNVTSDGDRVGDTAKRPIALAVAEFLQDPGKCSKLCSESFRGARRNRACADRNGRGDLWRGSCRFRRCGWKKNSLRGAGVRVRRLRFE